MSVFFDNFRIIDAESDFTGAVFVKNGVISKVFREAGGASYNNAKEEAALVIKGGGNLALLPGFIDMHVHFRAPGFPDKEVLESGALAAVRGGFTTAVCMANTEPVIDNYALARALRERASELRLADIYPVLSLTEGMRGKRPVPPPESGIEWKDILLLSEDGRDIVDDGVFLAALTGAAKAGVPVSCHCDIGGEAAAVKRAIELGQKARCRLHIAHVSTAETCDIIREAKKSEATGFKLSAEAAPHHLALTNASAQALGSASFGKVAPPLAGEDDRLAVIRALKDGVIDVIATDHAPHTTEDKLNGAPGFTGLETAFAVANSTLVHGALFTPQDLSRLMSARPAAILGLERRGLIAETFRADLVIADTEAQMRVEAAFASRGKNSPYIGKTFRGEIIMTLCEGRICYGR
jgi:dihydroorotase